MNAETTEPSDLVELLRARGLRVTSQRLVILRELRRLGHHASAEELHRRIQHDLPGASTPTVYATLDLLVDLGLAQKLDFGTGVSLYDARTDPHQHMVCRRCGSVEDLDGSLDAARVFRKARRTGFAAESAQFVLFGRCASCSVAGS